MTESDHERLLHALAERLQNQIGETAAVVRTHISSVILCGAFAYKLKRPVKLGFVDFSTLDKRRLDCENEWRLNRRTAPRLYRSVEPITGSVQSPEINGTGPVIDWVVRMERFAQNKLLSAQLLAGGVTSQKIDALADHLAQFQLGLPPLSTSRLAGTRPVEDWIMESLDCIASQTSPHVVTQVDAVRQHARSESHRLATKLAQRRAQGFFRECHGDLHLGNLVEVDGELFAFDALTFNEQLSTIDAMSDLAFPFMDLWAHQRLDLAWRLINRVLEQTGDYEGLPLLRYYTLYRACVRAKVAIVSHELETFERYWTLAVSLACHPPRPRLIFVSGLSGSGKSTIAQMIIETIGGARLRADVERKRLFAQAINRPNVLYSHAATDRTYARLQALSQLLVAGDVNVVVDATFLDPKQVDRFSSLAISQGHDALAVVSEANESAMRERIRRRLASCDDPSDANEAVLAKQIQACATPVQWPCKTVHVRNMGSLTELGETVQQLMAQSTS